MSKFDATCIFLLAITIGFSFGDERKYITDITPDQVRGVGESVNLTCTIDASMLDWSPAWFKRNRDRQSDPNLLAYGTEIIGGNPRMNVNKIGNEFVLTIKHIVLDDLAIYECQLATPSGQKETAQVELLIRRAPTVEKIEVTPTPVVPEGNSAQLKCIVEGYPRPTIYWSRENDKILPKGGNSVASIEYKIDEVSKEDRGLYYCLADNGVGEPHRRSVNFEVEFGPSISVPRPKVAQALDYDIELECRVEAYPAPSVVWYKQDLHLHDDGDYSISNTATVNEVTTSILRINTVEPEQYGDYICKASNKIGSAEARVNLFESLIYVNPWQAIGRV